MMMRNYTQGIFALVGMLLTACSSTPERAAWLDGTDPNYPQAVYLSASGEASSRSAADNRALANLAKIFEVSVADTSSDFSEARISQLSTGNIDEGGRTVENSQKLSRFVNTQAKQVLRGASIAERWQDPVSGQQYSLAVMKKAPAISHFTRAIRDADQQTEAAVNYAATQAPNAIAALGALEQARQRQVQRVNDNSNLRVLSGTDISAKYSVDDIDTLMRTKLASLSFLPQTADAETLALLQGSAAKVGVALAEDGDYGLTMLLDQGTPKKEQNWYWLRGSVELNVSEKGQTIANKRWPFKISAQNEEMLEQRLFDQLSAQLPQYILQLLTPAQSVQ